MLGRRGIKSPFRITTWMSPMKILTVVGARPNYMKAAPLHRALSARGDFEQRLLHTGQHYDERMSDVFFRQLGLPEPDLYLGVGSDTHARQTARIMMGFDEVLVREAPHLLVVVGDVNSTLACSLVAAKRGVPVAHIEAGLRSGDRTMPEEVNRVVTDSLSRFLFVTEPSGFENLRHEGVDETKIHLVGNLMIDTLVELREKARGSPILERLDVEPGGYLLMTMHRPANVDHDAGIHAIAEVIRRAAALRPVVFPVHPRTRQRLEQTGVWDLLEATTGVRLVEPLGYLDFLRLMEEAAVVVTDSGGIQEETTFLGVPCLTLRENTERPITITMGTNELLPLDRDRVVGRIGEILSGHRVHGGPPHLWDGRAAQRVVQVLETQMVPPEFPGHRREIERQSTNVEEG
jgi:UDP-N-acetylglucosamine 2-epimerase (non-hydrolysing)